MLVRHGSGLMVIMAVKDVVKRELEKCVPEKMRKVLSIA